MEECEAVKAAVNLDQLAEHIHCSRRRRRLREDERLRAARDQYRCSRSSRCGQEGELARSRARSVAGTATLTTWGAAQKAEADPGTTWSMLSAFNDRLGRAGLPARRAVLAVPSAGARAIAGTAASRRSYAQKEMAAGLNIFSIEPPRTRTAQTEELDLLDQVWTMMDGEGSVDGWKFGCSRTST